MATLSALAWIAPSSLVGTAVAQGPQVNATKEKPMVLVRVVVVLLNYGHSAIP